MSSDDRSWLMRTVMSMDQAASVPYFYPRLFALVRIHCLERRKRSASFSPPPPPPN